MINLSVESAIILGECDHFHVVDSCLKTRSLILQGALIKCNSAFELIETSTTFKSAIMSARQYSYEAFKHQIHIHEHIVQAVIRLFSHKEFAFDQLGL